MISTIINSAIPIAGIVIVLIAIFCPRFRTEYGDVGAFMHLSFVYWLLLLWADFGPAEFIPVWQTSSARVIIFIMVILVMNISKNHTRVCRAKLKDQKIEFKYAEKYRVNRSYGTNRRSD